MPFTRITDNDRTGKGTVGMADTPNLTAVEMQTKFDELPNLSITKFNTHIDEESVTTAASNIGAVDPTTNGTAVNVQGVLDNLHNKKQEKETGKGLSANDFTDTYKSALETSFEYSHTHTNKMVLDLFTAIVKNAYDRLVTLLTSITSVTTTVTGSDTALPTSGAISRYVQQMGGGDMVKSIYDTDNDGIVDHAEVADALQNPIAATAVTYDHTESDLTAVNAQAAIDEVHDEAKNSVQKSAIENDLVGTDAEKVLASPQGKALDDKITAINSNLGSLQFKYEVDRGYYRLVGADTWFPFNPPFSSVYTTASAVASDTHSYTATAAGKMLVSFGSVNSYGGTNAGMRITKNGTVIYSSLPSYAIVSTNNMFDAPCSQGRGGSYLLDIAPGDVISVLVSATLNGAGGGGSAAMNIKIS
jgi:hypothetical protein